MRSNVGLKEGKVEKSARSSGKRYATSHHYECNVYAAVQTRLTSPFFAARLSLFWSFNLAVSRDGRSSRVSRSVTVRHGDALVMCPRRTVHSLTTSSFNSINVTMLHSSCRNIPPRDVSPGILVSK